MSVSYTHLDVYKRQEVHVLNKNQKSSDEIAFNLKTSTNRHRKTHKIYCAVRFDLPYNIQPSKISFLTNVMNLRPSYKTEHENPVIKLFSSLKCLRIYIEPQMNYCSFRFDVPYNILSFQIFLVTRAMNKRHSYKLGIENPVIKLFSSI